jgi:hypothetical protein
MLRLFLAAAALACGAGIVASLMRGKTILPQRDGPPRVADRRKNPGLFWFVIVLLACVGAIFVWAALSN